ncbi:hypothetical protein [Modicisalibacter coralii]|uniref:hypothetical protein n=1 Tax=Modicisalibacter coralii TaxID=2304602 RepID=UPI00100B873C|nr:hypothetical protein [Halomonas coralii]
MIINTETHELESPRQISQSTGVPLPRNPPAETLARLDPPRAYVVESEPPAGDVVEPAGLEQGADGVWRQAWNVRDYTAAERAAQLEQAREEALARLNDDYNALVEPMIKWYPETEQKTWNAQEAEAKAYQAWIDDGSGGDPPATPKLSGILAGRSPDGSETMADLVAKVLNKVEQYSQALELMGRRQRGENLIAAAETPEEARAVTWESLEN